MRKINKIIIHCTGTPLNTSVLSIENYHLSLGYKEIGYHFIIDRFGFVHKGRPLDLIGAHCKGHNLDSIGIALIGGKDGKFDFTKKQIIALIDTVTSLRYYFSTQYSVSLSVYGHNDFTKNKTCPNFNVQNFFNYEGK